MLVEVGGRVCERGEDDDLAVARVDRVLALVSDQVTQAEQLVIACGADLFCCCIQGGKPVAVFDEVLLPTYQVHVAEQHLDLATHEQGFKGGVVNVHIGDVEFFDLCRVRIDTGQSGFYILQLAMYCECEGRDGAFHALEHVDAQQVNQALFTVHLPEEAFATANLGAVLLVVGFLLVRQDIAQRGVSSKVEAANLKVDVADGAEFPRAVYVCLDVDGGQPIWEATGFRRAVVPLNVPA